MVGQHGISPAGTITRLWLFRDEERVARFRLLLWRLVDGGTIATMVTDGWAEPGPLRGIDAWHGEGREGNARWQDQVFDWFGRPEDSLEQPPYAQPSHVVCRLGGRGDV